MAVTKRYKKLAGTSLTYQSRQFFTASSLHGVRYINERGRPFFEKFLWACCTAVGATIALIVIISVWEKFQTNPTITGLDTNFHDWDVPFPGVTFCPKDPVDQERLDDLIKRNFSHVKDQKKLREYLNMIGGLTRLKANRLAEFEAFQDFPFKDLKTISKDIVYRCESIFMNCAWKGKDRQCCDDMLFPIYTENGLCYGFNLDENQGSFLWNNSKYHFEQQYIFETDDTFSIQVESKLNPESNNMDIFIHASNEQPGRDIRVHHTWDSRIMKIAFSDKTTYTTPETRQLSIQQRRCIFPDEFKIFTNQNYTYVGCMRECRMKKAIQTCGCVPFLYNDNIKGAQTCDLKGLVCYGVNRELIMTGLECNCQLSCETSVYEVEMLTDNLMGENKVAVEFVSFPLIRYKREVLFGWADLLVSFGGIAGLFLGFSLLSGVETIYFFTMRAWCMVLREEETLERIQKEYDAEEKPILDLSLTPYFMKKERENEIIVPHLQHIRSFDEPKDILF